MANALLAATGTAQALCMATDNGALQAELIDTEAGGSTRDPRFGSCVMTRPMPEPVSAANAASAVSAVSASERGERDERGGHSDHGERGGRERYPLSGGRHGSSLLAGRREGGERAKAAELPRAARRRAASRPPAVRRPAARRRASSSPHAATVLAGTPRGEYRAPPTRCRADLHPRLGRRAQGVLPQEAPRWWLADRMGPRCSR